MKGDLHLHSYYSDGKYSPAEVMARAKAAGCEIAALTDHDTLDGIEEGLCAADKLGIKAVAGVEISSFDTVEAHILGYKFDIESARFCDFIARQKKRRRKRSDAIIAKLAECGITFPADCFDFFVKREISRSHIAAALVKYGYEPDIPSALAHRLRAGAPTFVAMEGVSPEDAIAEIHAAGGLAVLAHPVRLDLDPYARKDFIKRLASARLDGIEAVYKRSSKESVAEFRQIAANCGLFVTAGADFHREENEIIAREQNNPIAL